MTDRDLLRRIERSPGQTAGYKQLVRELGLGGGRERRMLLEQLDRLTAQGELTRPDRDHWALRAARAQQDLAAGRLDLHRDGFGFVREEPRGAGGEGDIFIPPNEIHGAMQGDQVLVELYPPRPDGRRSGRIVRILTRRNPSVVGIFHYARGDSASPANYVTPWDERMTQPILIPFGMENPPQQAAGSAHRVLGETAGKETRTALPSPENLEGMVVEAEITDWPTATRPARGRVLEILGKRDDFGVDVEIVIRKHHLPHIFPGNVLEEARAVARLDQEEIARRRSFHGLPIVTIDGETAKDFDDAVMARRTGDGWELQVHIADVAQYVTPASALDLEARLRGTSVYFPDRAVPMLPQELSSDICSLRPGEDRLVLSCIMHIDFEGEIVSYEVTEGVIRSARRMTYTQVHAIIEGDAAARSEFAPLVQEFEGMYELARLLHRKRQRRGSIDFDLPEPVIEFSSTGAMESIVRSERSWANRLIEEFMLSANECVASWLEQLGVPSLYRIHEKPEPRRVVEFEDIAASFGYSLGFGALPVKRMTMKSDRREQRSRGGNAPRRHEIQEDIAVTPRMYQQLALKIAGKPEERILSHLMLRSLRQARYSEKNEGHFALAAPCYTHFTSPIRRYPDLIVHRISKALLRAGISGHGVPVAGDPRIPWHEARAGKGRHHPPAADSSRHGESAAPASPLDETELGGIAYESSQAERRADDAERELMEWKKVKFMQERIGEDFDAMILSVTKYGCFVELDSLFIEGLVPILSLQDDHYTYRENTRQIIGENAGRRYSMGDRVRVVLDRVDEIQRRLQFSILEEAAPGRPKRAGKAKTKARAASAKAHPYKPPKNKVLRRSKAKNAHARKSGKKKR
ncbi:MAG TPA: RNB domain-containing ribonuclease [Acidobacteriaceae bacterium]|nr:RNB domain-containing ribonuclease [Acidobacteriaceae bacterium]